MTSSVRHARPIGTRGAVCLAIVACAVLSAFVLEASIGDLLPHSAGARIVREFFASALHPALRYETEVSPGTTPLLITALDALRRTLVFATASMSIALLGGALLGFLGSTAWWSLDPGSLSRPLTRWLRRTIAPLLYAATRVLIVAMRSVHELLWAVLFLAAFGLNPLSAVVAIAIPYAGTLAKVFSEMIDEAPRDGSSALRAAGAGPAQMFCFGLLPRALPDMSAYAFYRFECSVRSSAILGFFGFPTLGYQIRASFENLHYREVWTYIDALLVLVVAIELWSSALRRRFVA